MGTPLYTDVFRIDFPDKKGGDATAHAVPLSSNYKSCLALL
jgi:hypothetical protein